MDENRQIADVMRACVRQAIGIIRPMHGTASVRRKAHPDGKEDFVTDADLAAQEMYLRELRERFPEYGIVAEENGIVTPSRDQRGRRFTVDPLDGTKAFIRRQSSGIGTMLSLIEGDDVIAAIIGDVMSGEIYGYGPGDARAERLGLGAPEVLLIDQERPLSAQDILLRAHPMDYSAVIRTLVGLSSDRPRNRFGRLFIETGSIGLNMARLWKAEVGAIVLLPERHQPWDLCPVIGISKMLGFLFLPIVPVTDGVYRLGDDRVLPSLAPLALPETIVVHRSRAAELARLFLGE